MERRSGRAWGARFGPRTVVHVDMDAFFAQVEALDNPRYRGRPLIVGGRPDSPRGVVATCSYEARRFGVRSAMPIRQAVRLCPDAIFVTPRMDRYREVSRQIRDILWTLSPAMEPLSVDEAFLDMTGREGRYRSPAHLGAEVKRRIREGTGLTASVGVAPNKFIAKLASDSGKPDGLVVIPQHQVDRFLLPLPVDVLWGVGPRTAERLRRAGMHTVADVRARPVSDVTALLGQRLGRHVWNFAFGRDERPVQARTEAKSLGKEITFPVDVPDGPKLRAHLARLVASVGERMRRRGLYPRTVTVKVRFPDFTTRTRSRTLPEGFQDDETLFRHASALLDAFRLRRPLRLLGVSVSQFQGHVQVPLFPVEDEPETAPEPTGIGPGGPGEGPGHREVPGKRG